MKHPMSSMRLASLFSGGKDSTFAIHMAQKAGHEVVCLLSMFPESDESHLLHHPNIQWTDLQAKSMGIPQMTLPVSSVDAKMELVEMRSLLLRARDEFGIEGLVHGGIRSKFQKDIFGRLCSELGLGIFSPLWNMDARQYMEKLLDSGFAFIVTSVSADGLDGSWLGKVISKSDLNILFSLAEKFGFSPDFEGGEAETFVVDCPLFSSPVNITNHTKVWDGYRGRFEIVEAGLDYDA